MIVLVYGYDGSGPGHWQRWLEEELRRRGAAVAFPDLPHPTSPRKDAWVDVLAATAAASAPRPVTFVCHSLGCWALDHLMNERPPANARAALLVAPPSPYLLFEPVESFLPPPLRRGAWAPIAAGSLLVGSDDDDYTSTEELTEIGSAIGVRTHVVAGAGHINPASGYGPWPFALEWLETSGAL